MIDDEEILEGRTTIFFLRGLDVVLSQAKDNRVQFGAGSCVSNSEVKRDGGEKGRETERDGTERERERDLAGKKSSKLVCSTQQPAGGTKGGVKLGQRGVAAPRGWDQYSLFLSSALPRSRRPPATEGTLHNATEREPSSSFSSPLLSSLFLPRLFSFLFDGSLRARLAASLCAVARRREERRGSGEGFRVFGEFRIKA